ncbi:MAG: homocysteine S-methyltransferase family protein [Planctomycetota bacterium]
MPLDLKAYSSKLRVTDGAWGTQLQARGLSAGAAPELWNSEKPEAVEDVARSYVEAGSDIILTNTFGGNKFILAPHGAAEHAGVLCEAGAHISRRAAGTAVKVFGSIGPTGKVVMMGDVPEEELTEAFAQAASGLEHGEVDAIVLESFSELAEVRTAIRGVRKLTEVPLIASMTFASGPEKTNTMMGNSPAELAQLAEQEGIDAVGANCGVGPENYVKVARMLRDATDLPIWIKPNAGVPKVVDGKTTFPMGAAEFAGYVPAIIEAGANFIGGCCGTTPQHIRAVRKAVDEAAG